MSVYRCWACRPGEAAGERDNGGEEREEAQLAGLREAAPGSMAVR